MKSVTAFISTTITEGIPPLNIVEEGEMEQVLYEIENDGNFRAWEEEPLDPLPEVRVW